MDRQTQRASTAPKLVLEPVRENARLDSYPLATGRYLIGSSTDCDIVIAVGGVAPQHCLMIIGVNKTIVKAISPLTWINDGPLTEAVLKHGERLILGPVELRTRRPEVSEWIDRREAEPESPPAPVAYEPPQIEELLDHARQQLQMAIDDLPVEPVTWSEDLPLSRAVQMHAAAASQSADPAADSAAAQSPAVGKLVADSDRQELERLDLERTERSRALDYLATSLSAREVQLQTREQSLSLRESQLQASLEQIERLEQSLLAREQAFEARHQAEADATRQLAEREQALNQEHARIRQLDESTRQLVAELEHQAQALSERELDLKSQQAELRVREDALSQSQSAHALAMIAPVDTREIERREGAVTRREAVLTSSMAALQTSRDQITAEANQLEARFAELLQREQAAQQKHKLLAEQTAQADAVSRETIKRVAELEQREQALAASVASLAEREAQLQRLKSEIDVKDRELSNLRSELDIRDEALNQQFSQLQLDRSTLRAAQSKLQLAEQAANQRLTELDWASQQRTTEVEANLVRRQQEIDALAAEWEQKSVQLQEQLSQCEVRQQEIATSEGRLRELRDALATATDRIAEQEQELADERLRSAQARDTAVANSGDALQLADLEQQWANLAQERAELALDLRDLEEQRAELEVQQAQLEARRLDLEAHRLLTPAGEDSKIDAERQQLAAERAQLDLERQELDAARQMLAAMPPAVAFPVDDANPLGGHLQALLDERQSLAELQEEVLRERQSLVLQREEIQRIRDEFEQERTQLKSVRVDTETERDVYLLERQTLIAERQSLQDRERQIKQNEAELEQHCAEAERAVAEQEFQQKDLHTQRGHLEEEWASLREERAALRRAEEELDAQREELTLLAEQLAGVEAEVEVEPAPRSLLTPPPIPEAVVLARPQTEETPHGPVASKTIVAPEINPIESEAESDAEVEAEAEQFDDEPDPLAGFASFSSIGSKADDDLPPEIAEIIRRSGVQNSSASKSLTAERTVFREAVVSPTHPAIDARRAENAQFEAQRLRDLLHGSSDSYVDAASADSTETYESYEVVEEDPPVVEPSASLDDAHGEVFELAPDVVVDSETTRRGTSREQKKASEAHAEESADSSQLRSRLSEMFGIDLGRLRQSSVPVVDEAPVEQSEPEQYESEEYEPDETDREPSSFDEREPAAVQSIDQRSASPVDRQRFNDEVDSDAPAANPNESLDPVAAYMEQLLARTRKSKDHGGSHPERAAAKPAPLPVVPEVPKEEPKVEPVKAVIEELAPQSARQSRKSEPVDKEAMRANLDSFRTIANSQARSDVARSELRRLRITDKVKQIFLAISGGITLILASTELWSSHRYRLEMSAALLATAFLGYDYYRTRKRLRELVAIVPSEAEVSDDDVEDNGDQA